MFTSQLFRSFLPLRNPIGFGVSDFFLFAVTGLLVLIVLIWPVVRPFVLRLSHRTAWCMFALALLPITLRLLLLLHSPVPTPSGSDDFSFLLLADTLTHLRLANPSHPMHRFFETIFVMQEPTYSSMYPLGQGIVLAFGQLVFGTPWAGVLLATGALSSLCYWALRAFVRPEWAFFGGLLTVMQFGPLSYWMNSYWGGALAASAGCLVSGSLPRLLDRSRVRNALLLGAGMGIQLLTRPFEVTLLALSVALFFALSLGNPGYRRTLARALPAVALAVIPFVVLTAMQNRAVTGSWTTVPYLLNRYEYGIPATFTFQPNPVPHRALTPDEDLNYRAQSAIHEDGPETVQRFLERLAYRVRYYRFFLLAPLFIPAVIFVSSVRTLRQLWVVLTLLIFVIGSNFYPFFYPHYIAAATCLFVLASVAGLEFLSKRNHPSWLPGRAVAQVVILLCTAHFLFWYGLHLFAGDKIVSAMSSSESWDFINYGDPEGRIAISDQLARTPGKQLVFVRYGAAHSFHNWIHNAADIDSARVVLARDLGSVENEMLCHYYPERSVWLLEPDVKPPRLTRLPRPAF